MVSRRVYSFLAIIPAVIIIFGNGCGEIGFQIQTDSLSSELGSLGSGFCESELQKVYAKTYHPFLVANCNQCHGSAQGSVDVSLSFSAFQQRGVSVIDFRAVTAHGGNSLGPQMQPQINAFKPTWNEGQDSYIDCKSRLGSGGPQVSGIVLGNKVIPTLPTLRNNEVTTTWRNVEWDLEIDMPTGAQTYPMSLSLDVRSSFINGRAQGLEFRNPSARIKSTAQTFLIEGLQIIVNDELLSQVSTYYYLVGKADSLTFVNLAPLSAHAFYFKPNLVLPLNLSVKILGLSATGPYQAPPSTTMAPTTTTVPAAPLPSRITFAELTGSDPNLNVFGSSCVNCHRAGNMLGSLDITNFDQAFAKADLILARMKGTGGFMPPSGSLQQRRIDLVNLWITSGKPQN